MVGGSLRGRGHRVKTGERGVAESSSCSRNAHDRNVLVRRAQSRIDQATPKRDRSKVQEPFARSALGVFRQMAPDPVVATPPWLLWWMVRENRHGRWAEK